MTQTLRSLVRTLPKVDIHVHFEGLVGREQFRYLGGKIFGMAKCGDVAADIYRSRYDGLDDFISAIRKSNEVITSLEDCEFLVYEFLRSCHDINVVHVELSFEPEFHRLRGLSYDKLVGGIAKGLADGRRDFGITSCLILTLARDLSEATAIANVERMRQSPINVKAVGVASKELGHPLTKFKRVLSEVHAAGYHVVAHAGEEAPASYVWDAIGEIGVDRVDHGVRAVDDPKLLSVLADLRVPIAMCPISNIRTGVVGADEPHPAGILLQAGALVSINSDDPGPQQSTLIDDYQAVVERCNLSVRDLVTLVKNGIVSSFLPTPEKVRLIVEVDNIVRSLKLL